MLGHLQGRDTGYRVFEHQRKWIQPSQGIGQAGAGGVQAMAQPQWRQILIRKLRAKTSWVQLGMVVPLRQQQAAPFAQPLQVLLLSLLTLRQRTLPDHQAVRPDAVVEAEGPLVDPAIHAKGLQRRKRFADAHLIVGPRAVHQHLNP